MVGPPHRSMNLTDRQLNNLLELYGRYHDFAWVALPHQVALNFAEGAVTLSLFFPRYSLSRPCVIHEAM